MRCWHRETPATRRRTTHIEHGCRQRGLRQDSRRRAGLHGIEHRQAAYRTILSAHNPSQRRGDCRGPRLTSNEWRCRHPQCAARQQCREVPQIHVDGVSITVEEPISQPCRWCCRQIADSRTDGKPFATRRELAGFCRHVGPRKPLTRSLGGRLLGDFREEFVVGLERLQSVDQQLEARGRIAIGSKTAQYSTQFPNHLQLLAIKEKFFVSSA